MTNSSMTRSETVMLQWIIYDHPYDFPDRYVMRLWRITMNGIEPTNHVLTENTLDDLRALVPADCVCLPRHPDDDPAIIETWL